MKHYKFHFCFSILFFITVFVSTGSYAKTLSLNDANKLYFTDTVLTDQNGVSRKFYSDLVSGKIVLINFAFTSCKGICSPATRNLRNVQKLIQEEAKGIVNFITVSVDPLNDTPEVLKAFSSKFEIGKNWYFLTGKPESINIISKKLGGFTEKPDQHPSTVFLGDALTGEWTKTFSTDQSKSIVEEVRRLIQSRKISKVASKHNESNSSNGKKVSK